MSPSETPTVVLVHGGFADGSGWQGVYEHLKKDGYTVSVVQNPTVTLEDDVAVTRRAIDAAGEPVILVGHSYGGAVVTEAGTHPNVAAVVYITAFVPDAGESRSTPSSRASRRTGRSRRFSRRRTGCSSSTARSSMRLSRTTCARNRPRSWPTRGSPGVWARLAAR